VALFNIRLSLGGFAAPGDVLIDLGESVFGGPMINLPKDAP